MQTMIQLKRWMSYSVRVSRKRYWLFESSDKSLLTRCFYAFFLVVVFSVLCIRCSDIERMFVYWNNIVISKRELTIEFLWKEKREKICHRRKMFRFVLRTKKSHQMRTKSIYFLPTWTENSIKFAVAYFSFSNTHSKLKNPKQATLLLNSTLYSDENQVNPNSENE